MEKKYDRFLDADQEPRRMLQPIEGYQNIPLVSLTDAVESIVTYCPDIHRRVFIAMSNCEDPADGLNQNESSSIYLYTMEWEPRDECLYYILNKTLRSENRQKLKPWFPYLKLILTALHKLPSQKKMIYRGVTLDLNEQYQIGKRYVWWALSSCTQSIAVLESELFLGKHGSRTLFNIECDNGKMIRSHSYIALEDEILLLPATHFEVKSKLNPTPGLHIIHLKQVNPPFPLIELPSATPIVQMKLDIKKDEQQRSNNDRNEKLEQQIARCADNDQITLKTQRLTDDEISIVVQRAISDKKCTGLNISWNEITDTGAEHLGKALQSNMTLKALNITGNRVSDAGARWIAQSLHTNTTLTELRLTDNRISSEGAKYLAEALRINLTLKNLNLDTNSIGDSGIQYFTQALIRNQVLTIFSIRRNGITDKGITHLAEMLKQNSTLTHLFLDDNPLTNNGMKTLMDALCNNRELFWLNIGRSGMTGKCIGDIQNMFILNETLGRLCLSAKAFSGHEQKQIEEMAKTKNCTIDWVQ